ncbi:MerR family transcriptional regulator [Streptomyces parvus]|uniref:MerR family transcriptional regulator n=1 Tax=Streptomyces parvus TaxID=66428 RepID=UPI0033E20F0A
MRIGELAARTQLSRDTIRYYERVGLITGHRLANGYRDFPLETVDWLNYVRTAQSLGFSLAEITRTGQAVREAADSAELLSAVLQEKIRLIDARMAQLAELRADLAQRVDTICPLRASTAAQGHARQPHSPSSVTGVPRPPA